MRGNEYCLFSAPSWFLGETKENYEQLMPTVFREVWDREELQSDPSLFVWVVNPGQRFVVDNEILDLYPSLAVVVTPSTGRNHIDMEACGQRSIRVFSLLDDRETLNTISASAEFSFLLLLNTLRRLDVAIGEVTAGRWRSREDVLRGYELSGRQVGLVGLGRNGQRLARWCTAFDARVAYHDPYVADDKYPAWSLEKIFTDCDVICVCCALTQQTVGMVNGSLLERLKPGACFVNTARGEVACEADLVEILEKRKDLRVGLDVLSGEVTNTHLASPLLEMHARGQIVISPHIAGATFESQRKAAMAAVKLLRKYLSNLES